MEMYHKAYNINVLTTRSFNHCGPGQSELFVVSDFCKQVIEIEKKIKPPVIYVGNIDVKRDFGFSADYVKVMYKSLMLDHPDDYIICSGESTSLRKIVYYVFDKLGLSRTLIIESDELYRPNEIRDIFGDNSKIKSTLSHERFLTIWELLDVIIEEELNNIK
jgi:GDPmannose 4,6-dehydratase